MRSEGRGYSSGVPLHLIHTSDKPKRKKRPAVILECHRCRGREIIETKIGMIFEDGKAKGGTKQYLCACCHRKGERVVLA